MKPPKTKEKKSHWEKWQIKSFVKQVRDEVGNGWAWLTPRVRAALVAECAFNIIRGQVRESVSIEAMDDLYLRMLVEIGLEPGDD